MNEWVLIRVELGIGSLNKRQNCRIIFQGFAGESGDFVRVGSQQIQQIIVASLIVVTSWMAGAAPVSKAKTHASVVSIRECSRLSLQLHEMQRAQGILLESMVKKNDSLAGTLDHFADDLSSHDQKSKKGDIVGMRKSAEAFRGHSDRELVLIAKFQKRSQELIDKTSRCLAQNTVSSKELRQSSGQVLLR